MTDAPSGGNRRLRVHLYVLCWNDEILLPHFFRHYAWLERIFAYDNLSRDGTRELIDAAPNTELRTLDTGSRFSEDNLLAFKNNAWKQSCGRADFVVVCDSDELLHHPQLEAVLHAMRDCGATIAVPMAYQMVGDRVPRADEDLLAAIPTGVRLHNYDKCVLFDPNAIDDINFGPGAHVCRPTGRVRYFRVPGLSLLHYKFLSLEHVAERYRAATQRTADRDKARGIGAHQRISRETLESRYQTLSARQVDAVAALSHAARDGRWRRPCGGELARDYREGLRAFRRRDYRQAYDRLCGVLAWQPDRFAASAALAAVLHFRGLFHLESTHVLHRTEAMATSTGTLRRAEALARMADFYLWGNHPLFARHCLKLARNAAPDRSDI